MESPVPEFWIGSVEQEFFSEDGLRLQGTSIQCPHCRAWYMLPFSRLAERAGKDSPCPCCGGVAQYPWEMPVLEENYVAP